MLVLSTSTKSFVASMNLSAPSKSFSCVISKMLGHTNVRMTQVYAMVTQDKLFEEADKFIEATKDFVLVLNANSKEIVNKQRQ